MSLVHHLKPSHCLALLLFCSAANALAQQFPTRPLRVIVPFPPGGATDVIARLVGQKLSETWGHVVVIDNRAGATGAIGSEIVARAQPDGYTILLGALSTHAINPSLYKSMPYDAATVNMLPRGLHEPTSVPR